MVASSTRRSAGHPSVPASMPDLGTALGHEKSTAECGKEGDTVHADAGRLQANVLDFLAQYPSEEEEDHLLGRWMCDIL